MRRSSASAAVVEEVRIDGWEEPWTSWRNCTANSTSTSPPRPSFELYRASDSAAISRSMRSRMASSSREASFGSSVRNRLGTSTSRDAREVLVVGGMARAVGLSRAAVEEEQVEVGVVAELAAAQLAEADHHHAGRRAVGVAGQAVAALHFRGGEVEARGH